MYYVSLLMYWIHTQVRLLLKRLYVFLFVQRPASQFCLHEHAAV